MEWASAARRIYRVGRLLVTPLILCLYAVPSFSAERPGEATQAVEYCDPATGMEFVLIPAGRFLMGSPPSERVRFSDYGEQPFPLRSLLGLPNGEGLLGRCPGDDRGFSPQ